MTTNAGDNKLVVRIFLAVDPLLRQIRQTSWWCGGITAKTWLRWRKGPTGTISRSSVSKVALSLWDSCHLPEGAAIRPTVFQRIVELAPTAAAEDWIKEPATAPAAKSIGEAQRQLRPELERKRALFGEWFSALVPARASAKTVPLPSIDPLTLDVDVLVAPAQKTTIEGYRPLGPELLPVSGGQRLRVLITCNRAVYLYAWWISPAGALLPLYPWKTRDWAHLAVKSPQPVRRLALPWDPKGKVRAWPIAAERGLETLVVLAREQPMTKKMRAEVRRDLTKLLAGLPVPDPGLIMGAGPHKSLLGAANHGGTRGLGRKEELVEDPAGDRHRALDSQLGLRGDAGACVSFLNAG